MDVMKRILKSATIVFLITFILIAIPFIYFHVWGGKLQIKNFGEVADGYESIAETVLDYYSDKAPSSEYIIINTAKDTLTYGEDVIELTDSQKEVMEAMVGKFDYMRVCKDAVFFYRDETGYYGLVYSKKPLQALYKSGLLQSGRSYHRINSRWYEWGVWGI